MGSPTHPPFNLGTRGSDLALAQAVLTETALAAAGFPVQRHVIATIGDKRQDLKLSEFSKGAAGASPVLDKGIFTKELELALADRTIDFAVHSLKDVPTELAAGYAIVAVLERAPIEDVLISKTPGGIPGLPHGATVATSSVRRAAQLAMLRPDLQVVDIRGNVPTRIQKLADNPGWHAIILAHAGLARLGMTGLLQSETTTVLDPQEFLPAAGQGAVGIEVYRPSSATLEALQAIDHEETHLRVRAERHFLHLLKAGCQTPVGAHTWIENGQLHLRALVFPEDGSAPRRSEASAPAPTPEAAAEAAFAKLG
jgi:hydroxymethylbilane synthase